MQFLEEHCAHGGQSFDAVGNRFESLDRRLDIINADVLDAWFDPSPKAIGQIQEHLPWLLRSSPPTHAEGLAETIAEARGIPADSIAIGGGSSNLIFLAFGLWLGQQSRALIADPSYGEYAHVLEQVIGCRVDRFPLERGRRFAPDLDELERWIGSGDYDLVALVNPSNPTGAWVSKRALEKIVAAAPYRTTVWIDEAYLDFVDPAESFERIAADSRNAVVCKSLSKVYALAGARAAYLCGPPQRIAELRSATPPWPVGLVAQVAAVAALNDPDYYAQRYAETRSLRGELAQGVRRALPCAEVLESPANWILCFLPDDGPDAGAVCARCEARGVFLRDLSSVSTRLGSHATRIAVKESEANRRIVESLAAAMEEIPG